jgi:hypothetical protein
MGVAKNYTGEKTEFQPFKFAEKPQRGEKKPFLIIELVIAPGKKVKVPLYREGTPNEIDTIVNNLSQTFNMSRRAKESLREVVTSHINSLDHNNS